MTTPIADVIFLDVDGVLNRLDERGEVLVTLQAPGMTGAAVVDLNITSALDHVLRQVPWIRLVTSSTWRISHPSHDLDINTLADFCRYTRLGADLFHPDWRTDLIDPDANRAREVGDWLRKHPEVTRSATIDDNFQHEFRELPQCRFIRVDWRDGLTFDRLEQLMLHFGVRVMPDLSIRAVAGPLPTSS